MRTYYPYEPIEYNNITQWGKYVSINLTEFDFKSVDLFRKFKNLNGYPLRISLFSRFPTCIKFHSLPKTHQNSYLMKDAWRASGFGGVDGLLLQNAAKTLNFSTNLFHKIGVDFGYKASNGTSFGKTFILLSN